MADLASKVLSTLDSLTFIDNYYPALTQWGVKDEDVFIHSLGCSVWNTLGHTLGYMAVVEAPAPMAAGNDIRSDSVWFDYHTQQPCAVVEFERYQGSKADKQKLEGKLLNLLEAYHRWNEQPSVLVLSFWSTDVVSAPDFDSLKRIFKQGATNSKGVFIPGAQYASLVIHRCLFATHPDNKLYLEASRFTEVK